MTHTALGIFNRIEDTAAMVKPLEEGLKVPLKDVALLSVAPYPDGTLFYDKEPTPLWVWALIGGFVGIIGALFLAGWTQWHLNLIVGGKPTWSPQTVGIIGYEFTLLGAVVGTFLGTLWYSDLPDWNKLAFDAEISKSKIGLLVRCEDEDLLYQVEELMNRHNAIHIIRGRDDF